MEMNSKGDISTFDIKNYILASLISKKRSSQTSIVKYLLFLFLFIVIMTIILIKKVNSIKAIQEQIDTHSTAVTINNAKISEDIEMVLEEKRMRKSLATEKDNKEKDIKALQAKKEKLEQSIASSKKEHDYIVTYVNDKNLELASMKKAIKDKQAKLNQVQMENIELNAKVALLNKTKPIPTPPINSQAERNVFLTSLILTFEDMEFIQNWIPQTFKLKCFESKDHGFNAAKFHSFCDSVGPTLFIVKTTKNEVYGGFTKQSWGGRETKGDDSAVVFNLSKKQIFRVHFVDLAITTDPGYFVQFGKDLVVANDSGVSSFPYYYGTINSQPDVFQRVFEVSNIEVFS